MDTYFNTYLLSRKEVSQLTGLSAKKTNELFLMDGFPIFGEVRKGQKTLTPYGEFMKWYAKQIQRR